MSSRDLVEYYRKCLERDCEHSVPSTCTDLKLKGLIRKCLEKDPELHASLQNRGALMVIEQALVAQPDVVSALKSLVRAFEVLELAAVNLYCFPWRQEFCMIKMFSGGYVHNLKSVFSEEDIADLLSKMGYAKSTGDQCFKVAHHPSVTQLMVTACAFFVARVECEMLLELVSGLNIGKVSATHVIQERRKNIGGMDGCMERLQKLALHMEHVEQKKPEVHVFQAGGSNLDGDIYTAGPAQQAQHPDLYSDSLTGRKEWKLESYSSLPVANPELCGTCFEELHTRHGVLGSHKCKGNGKDIDQPVQYDPEVKKSFVTKRAGLGINYPFENLDGANSSKITSCESPVAEICVTLARGAAYKLHDCVIDKGSLGYRCDSCQTLHEFMCREVDSCRSRHHQLTYIMPEEKDAILAEIICQRYHAHNCIPKDAFPFCRCDTCLVLHYIECSDYTHCKTMKHAVHLLYKESDQKLWLRRTKLDSLFVSGSWV